MSDPQTKDNITVRVYRKGRDTLDDMIFVLLLIFVLLGFAVRLVMRCLQ